tara:strand:+ start:3295 stop:3528 length:234 start_codon:yes stop_codon:yes gene_type:complete
LDVGPTLDAVYGTPLVALDTDEHSYHMNYSTEAAKYVEAFMRHLDWDVVNQRFRQAIGAWQIDGMPKSYIVDYGIPN